MAFLLNCSINDYEVRSVTSGTSKKGNIFKSIKLESPDGNSCEVSCTNDQLFTDVDKLRKGDIISARVLAVSGRERSYITLLGTPVVSANAYSGAEY